MNSTVCIINIRIRFKLYGKTIEDDIPIYHHSVFKAYLLVSYPYGQDLENFIYHKWNNNHSGKQIIIAVLK